LPNEKISKNEGYADKGYSGGPNSKFLHMNQIEDGIMGKDTKSAKLTDYEKERNKKSSKSCYIVKQYFGISHLHRDTFRARFPRLIKNAIDTMSRQMAFNLFKGTKILGVV
jgi:IS5 family transposase